MYIRNLFSPAKSKTLLTVILFIYLYGIVYYFVIPQPTTTEDMYIRTMISSLIFGLLAIWAMQKDNLEFRLIGFQTTKLYQAIFILFIGWSIFSAILLCFLMFSGKDVIPIFAEPKSILLHWLFVGIGEELLYRGYLITSLLYVFTSFPQKRQIFLAVILDNTIFATAHIPSLIYNTTQQDRVAEMLSFLPAAFVLGLVFTYFFLRTRNILLAGLIHGSINVPLIRISDDQLYLVICGTGFIIILVIITEMWVHIQSRQKKVIVFEQEAS